MKTYDIIGDIHGSGDKLRGLLHVLGWTVDDHGVHRHPDENRMVIFVGDLVDRGEDQRGVLTAVKNMIDAGTAHIVMGNHEFNAVSYATLHPNGSGDHLRIHSPKNATLAKEFLEQLCDEERAEWIEWFKTLPLWLDLGDLRIVHACWHQNSIDFLEETFGGSAFPEGIDAFVAANEKGNEIYRAIEVILKCPEMELSTYGLPKYLDKGGHPRGAARVAWWHPGATSIRDLIDIPGGTKLEDGTEYPAIPDLPCTEHDRSFSYSEDIPVFYGHHWRQWAPEEHKDWTPRTACVDFSAVAKGPLVAYSWRGERTIEESHYVRFPADRSSIPTLP
jgi:hypothetical protein